MRLRLQIAVLALLVFAVTSCNREQNPTDSNTPIGAILGRRATPTAAVLADSFFYGCAYLDANENGEIDEEDPGVKGAIFLVALNSGGGFGVPTSSSGCATVVVPGGLGDDAWPVTARMDPPEETGYVLTGVVEVVLEKPQSQADFLFVAGQP